MAIQMLYRFQIVCLVLFSVVLKGQDSVSYTFQNRMDINDSLVDSGMKTILWNGGLLTLGYAYDSGIVNLGTTLSFTDTNGVLVWKKTFFHPTSNILQGNDIFAFDSSSFYVIGIKYTDSINNLDPYLAKFNSTGDSVFFAYFPDVGYNYALHALPLSPDSIVVLSSWKDSTYAMYVRNKIWMTDTAGGYTTLHFANPSLKFSYQLIKHGNNYFLGGNRRTSASSSFYLKVFIDVFGPGFNQVGAINPSTTLNEYYNQLFIFNKTLYLGREISTYNGLNGNPFYKLKIDRFNSSYGLVHEDLLGGFWQNIYWARAINLNDSVVILPKYHANYTAFYIADANFDSITQFKAGHPLGVRSVGFSGITPKSKKVFGTGGFRPSQTQTQDHYYFLTESIQKKLSLGIEDVPLQFYKQSTLLFPNPFKDFVGFIGLPENRMYEVSVFNSDGRLVLKTSIYAIEKLQTNRLHPGVYTFLINDGGTFHKNYKAVKVD